MENNKSQFKRTGVLHDGAECIEIQISHSGDAARYVSTIMFTVRDPEVTRGRWQEIRYSKRNGYAYIVKYGKRLYLYKFLRIYQHDSKRLYRLQCDCNYYLGHGGRNAQRCLWAHDEQKQIDKMRELYDLLPVKPEWLTREQIDEYAARMGVK